MIAGTVIQDKTTKSYRSIEVDSYSSLKKFAENPMGYYKEFILGEKPKEKKGHSMIMGDLVDCLLFTPEEYHSKFEEATCGEIDKATTTQVGHFALALWDVTLENTSDGVCTKSFTAMAEEAFNRVKYDKNGEEVRFKGKKVDAALTGYIGSKFQDWYELQRKGVGKTLIDQHTKDAADKIVEELRGNRNINYLLEGNEDLDVFFQEQIEYDLFGMEFKSMFDIIRVNHNSKSIRGIDLKCTWEVLDFAYNYYKMKYYIQEGCYYKGLEAWRDEHYPDYNVLPVDYLVADNTGTYEPILYQFSRENVDQAIYGFEYNGKPVDGVKKLVEDLVWAKENANFRIRKDESEAENTKQMRVFK